MKQEPLEIFTIRATVYLGWWERIKVILGRNATVLVTLPVFEQPEHIGGLRGEAESSVSVPPLIRRRGMALGEVSDSLEPMTANAE